MFFCVVEVCLKFMCDMICVHMWYVLIDRYVYGVWYVCVVECVHGMWNVCYSWCMSHIWYLCHICDMFGLMSDVCLWCI